MTQKFIRNGVAITRVITDGGKSSSDFFITSGRIEIK
jgi:hypothetical protein